MVFVPARRARKMGALALAPVRTPLHAEMQSRALSPALAYRLLRWRSPVRGWLAALMLLLLALAAQVELGGLAADRPFLFFVPAVIAATVLGGRVPAAALALAAAAAAWLLFLDPSGTPGFLPQAVSILFFLVLSAAGILVLDTLIRCAARLEAERSRAGRMAELHRMLLQELQHRTANHMQFVSGVLSLQARRVADAESARTVLREAGLRLDTLARVHRRLCQTETTGGGLAQLVQEISQDLLTVTEAENIVCVVDMAPVQLEPERLTRAGAHRDRAAYQRAQARLHRWAERHDRGHPARARGGTVCARGTG